MTITELEKLALLNIRDNDFSTGPTSEIWSDSINDSPHANVPSASLGGVISSLRKKNLARSQGDGDESTIHLTEQGAALAATLQ